MRFHPTTRLVLPVVLILLSLSLHPIPSQGADFDDVLQVLGGFKSGVGGDITGDQMTNFLDVFQLALDWKRFSTTLVSSDPLNGEVDVSVTRETILRFSHPLAATTVNEAAIFASFGGQELSGRLNLSPNRKTVTLFYDDPLPSDSRVRVWVDGDLLRDVNGNPVNVDRDADPGGLLTIDFDTLGLTFLPGTSVFGRVFASELITPKGGTQEVNLPLEGVTIRVDGTSVTTETDLLGNFTLDPAPIGKFFVHIDGTTVSSATVDGATVETGFPEGPYYPNVGKAWVSSASRATNVGDVYLPLVLQGALGPVSSTEETRVGLPEAIVSDRPELADLALRVPADSLYSDDGTRGGMVGLGVVDPNRLPGELPEGLEFPFVITVQTDGPTNFDEPAPVCFPNLDDPVTGEPLLAGETEFLYSFNHDKGIWEAIGSMTVSQDGSIICADPGVGIRAPGWHAPGPPPVTGPPPPPPANTGGDGGDSGGGGCPPPPPGGGPGGVGSATDTTFCEFTGSEGLAIFIAECNDAAEAANFEGPWYAAYMNCINDAQQKVSDYLMNECGVLLPPECTLPDAKSDNLSSLPAVGKTILDDPLLLLLDPIYTELLEIFQQIVVLGIPHQYTGIPPEVQSQIDALLAQADQVAGGDYLEYLRTNAVFVEEYFEELRPFFGDSPHGNAPAEPLKYVATVIRPSETLILRGETQGFGQYRLFIPRDGELVSIHFYDALGDRYGSTYPASSPNVEFTLGRVLLFPVDDSFLDFDEDGLPDLVEEVYGTDPTNPDSDADGIPDGAEVEQGLNPLDGFPAITGVIAAADTPGTAVDVVAENDLAFIADSEAGVQIFNVFNGMDPVVIGRIDTPGEALMTAFSENRLVVADGEEGLAFIDVSDPPNAEIVNQLKLGGSVKAVAAANGIAYVGVDTSRLFVIDMATSFIYRQISFDEPILDIVTGLENLYVLTETKIQTVGYLTDAEQVKSEIEAVAQTGGNRRLFAGSDTLYSIHRTGFSTYDLVEPGTPALVGATPTSFFGWGELADNGSGIGVTAAGPNTRFDTQRNVMLYDVSNPEDTNVFITQFPTDGSARSVSIFNALAYVADGTRGLKVVNYLPYDSQGAPPEVTLSASFIFPVTAEVERGKATVVAADVNDDVQVRNVEFYLDGERVFTDGNYPFAHHFVTPHNATKESFQIRARAFDTGGNSAWSATRTVTLLPETRPPAVIAFVPNAGGRIVRAVQAIFDEPIDPNTLDENSFELFALGDAGKGATGTEVLSGSFSYEDALNRATLAFAQPLPDDRYRAVLRTTVTDLSGNGLVADFEWTFQVADAVFWIGPSGDWDNGFNWSGGALPTASDDTIVNVPGSVVVDHDDGEDAAKNLYSEERIEVTGGSLTVDGVIEVNNDLYLNGGTIKDAVIEAGSMGRVTTFIGGSVLDGVTLNKNMSYFWPGGGLGLVTAIENNLTLNSRISMSAGSSGNGSILLRFNGSGDLLLNGTGEILFNTNAANGIATENRDNTLHIGSDILIFGARGSVSPGNGGCLNNGTIRSNRLGTITLNGNEWINEGLVAASDTGSLDLEGNWVNRGTITISAGTLNIGGDSFTNQGTISAETGTIDVSTNNWKLSDLGNLSYDPVDTRINLVGGVLDNATGIVLDASTGSWGFSGATILGGTVTLRDGANLIGPRTGGGILEDVVLDGNLTLGNQQSIRFDNTLTLLNSTIEMLSGGGGNDLAWISPFGSGTHRVQGNGTLLFGSFGNNGFPCSNNQTLIIEEGIAVRGFKGFIGTTHTNFFLINDGTIESLNAPNLDLRIQAGGGFTNNGVVKNSGANGTVQLRGATVNNGRFEIDPGRLFDVVDDVTQTTSGTLQIHIQGLGDHGLVEGHPDNTVVSLDGTLEITLAEGYEPDLGATFEIITANRVTGTFPTILGESIGNGKKFIVQYNDTNVILQVVAE